MKPYERVNRILKGINCHPGCLPVTDDDGNLCFTSHHPDCALQLRGVIQIEIEAVLEDIKELKLAERILHHCGCPMCGKLRQQIVELGVSPLADFRRAPLRTPIRLDEQGRQTHEHDPLRDRPPRRCADGSWVGFIYCTCGMGFGIARSVYGEITEQDAVESLARSLAKHCSQVP